MREGRATHKRVRRRTRVVSSTRLPLGLTLRKKTTRRSLAFEFPLEFRDFADALRRF